MKQKDWTLVIVVIIISVVVSIVITKAIITPPKNRQQKVEIIEPISDQFPTPDSKYFNSKSIDPTQLIKIGDSSNPAPFNTH